MTHSEYKEKAREHQIRFKEEVLHIPLERSPLRLLSWIDNVGVLGQREIKVGSSLLYADSKDSDGNYVIFYPGFRKEISEAVEQSTSSTKSQLITNLLRSEHIPYNIFFPMRYDLVGWKTLFNNLLGGNRIASIERIAIEYNPGGLRGCLKIKVNIGEML